MTLTHIDEKILRFLRRYSLQAARVALFVVFFWFGVIKLIDLSPAGPLAEALIRKTVGIQYFNVLFHILALLECLIGVLFLIPKAVRITIPLLVIHMLIVCSPLVFVPELTWQQFLVPTLEGQYIIKNVVIIALAMGIAAQAAPLRNKKGLTA